MPLLDEIGDRLVAQGVGALSPSASAIIFRGAKAIIPDGEGPYLTLIETGGLESMGTQNDTATERPTFQVAARAEKYAIARAKLQQAYDALGGANGLFNLTLSGTWYVRLKARQPPTDLGQLDARGRAMLTFNVDVEKVPS